MVVLAGGNNGDVSFNDDPEHPDEGGSDGGSTVRGSPRQKRTEPPVVGIPAGMEPIFALLRPMMEGISAQGAGMMALAKAAQEGGSKRKRNEEDDEEEEAKGRPVLIHKPNHDLKDNAHDVMDWVARVSCRPYNGGDQELFWANMPVKSMPVIEDLKMTHLTKSPINPNIIGKLHDRGKETTGKQWLSGNYAVEGKGGRIRADNDRTAGAFVLDYTEPSGAWDVIDGMH